MGFRSLFTSHIILPATNNQSLLSLAVENQGKVPAEGVIVTLNFCDSLRPIRAENWKPVNLVNSKFPMLQQMSNRCLWATPQSPNIPSKEFYQFSMITIGFTNQAGVSNVWHTVRMEVRDRSGVKVEADALLLFRTNVTDATIFGL